MPLPGPAILIARSVPDDKFHDRLFGELPSAPSVAWIGAASGDQRAWYERVAAVLRKRFGARVSFARSLPAADVDLAETRRILDDAQVIYLGGGDVGVLADALRGSGLDEHIKRRRREGAYLVGVSAGAIGLGRYWVKFPDDDDELAAATRFECVGAVPIVCDCHDEESDWEELKELLAAWRREAPGATVDAYGIPLGGALWLDGEDRVTPLGAAPKVLRLVDGKLIE
jgi:peptidase E